MRKIIFLVVSTFTMTANGQVSLEFDPFTAAISQASSEFHLYRADIEWMMGKSFAAVASQTSGFYRDGLNDDVRQDVADSIGQDFLNIKSINENSTSVGLRYYYDQHIFAGLKRRYSDAKVVYEESGAHINRRAETWTNVAEFGAKHVFKNSFLVRITGEASFLPSTHNSDTTVGGTKEQQETAKANLDKFQTQGKSEPYNITLLVGYAF